MNPGAISSPGSATISSSGCSGGVPSPTHVTMPPSIRTPPVALDMPRMRPRSSVLIASSPLLCLAQRDIQIACRRRQTSASIALGKSASQHEDCHLSASMRFSKRAVNLIARASAQVVHDSRRAVSLLFVGAYNADHPAPVRMAEPREHPGADHVQDDLLNSAGLEARRPGDDLWSRLDFDRDVRRGAKRRSGRAAQPHDQCTRVARHLKCREDKCGAAARAYSDSGVTGTKPGLACGLAAFVPVVLGHVVDIVGLHPARVDPKGCGTFGGVQRSQLPAGSGAEVMQVAALTKSGGDLVDSVGDLTEA